MRFQSLTVVASLAVSTLACSPLKNFKMTFYGYPDNSPPGAEVRYNCGGRNNKAAGSGTYENPLTMAAEAGRFATCEIVYSPYLKKYLRMEDSCANCSGDWVDVWLGSTTSSGGSALMSCQQTLTGSNSASHAIIQAPPNNLEVNSGELFSGSCASNMVSAAADSSASCSGGSTAPAAPAAAPPAPNSPAKAPEHTTIVSKTIPSAPTSGPEIVAPSSPAPDAPSSGLKVSTDGRCGGDSGFTCLGSFSGDCCSKHGWCGKSGRYCKAKRGCQAGFGKCK